MAILWLSVLAVVATGCISGAAFQRGADELQVEVDRLHDAAFRCDAERPMAVAEANLEFLRYEMQRGKYLDARDHLDVANTNIQEVRDRVDGRPECFGAQIVRDSDGDGLLDPEDNCRDIQNPEQTDIDHDGIGDVCDEDADGDGIPNAYDNCVRTPNPDQRDSNADGVGDACSEDRDGDGIVNTSDRCPDVPEDRDGFEDGDGCPDPDNDHDGRDDEFDRCPVDPEDVDGYEDADGCPDPDNDSDGILDVSDACPLDPEDLDGDADDDGCPEEDTLVVLTDSQIEIRQQINFETGSSTITGALSFRILDEVAVVLYDHATIEIRVEGHTDSQGSASYNQQLSQGRADAVRTYLMSQGIAGGRITAVGYGEERPIDTNETDAGRAVNRRVEFHITAQ
ncbi:MAG: OmpA family protein [Myxococcales bacterium]|nr:OmpA family protein [Myxococcales bacterium]MCB9534381.1 OmpA family protein [Myxococcales bacterium]